MRMLALVGGSGALSAQVRPSRPSTRPCGQPQVKLPAETGHQSLCTGTTLRDGVEREVREGFMMGDTCTPMADSCQCMAKATTIL